jgi:mono/diheme cytochrome c family protein
MTQSIFERISKRLILFSLLSQCLLGTSVQAQDLTQDPSPIIHGKKVWFENTYGGEKFFYFLANHPDPAKRIQIGFEKVIDTPRSQRFQEWGVVNDPDCKSNPNGGPDICKDSQASGVLGIRKLAGPNGKPIYGVTCASCHAGFNPFQPPKNVNEPKWENIHPTIGNQYLDSGKIFSINLPPTDPRRLMFAAWPKGTVDTTLLFNDNIMNPGVITAFWNLNHRPEFEIGHAKKQMRAGQGGEDDLGGAIAAIRVYTNIGVCFSECVFARPGKPIDIAECKKSCKDFPPQNDLDDLVRFLKSVPSPRLRPATIREYPKYVHGKKLFETNCASCHSMEGQQRRLLSNDEVNPLKQNSAQNTNQCRALTSNWEEGKIWEQFSSDHYKRNVVLGNKGYRTMPLTGIWATAPFLHNQSIGEWAPANASIEERVLAYQKSMEELLNANRTPKVYALPFALGPFPAGTPLTYVFSRDPVSQAVLCNDSIENRGHTYGSHLSKSDKDDLIYWLMHQ